MTPDPTPQQKMEALMKALDIPYKEIRVYGGQIVVTCRGWETAKRWNTAIARFAKVQRVLRSYDYAKVNRGTVNNPTMVPVWRVFGCLD